jgi:predicted PurR-regulated permease PerM
MSVQTSELERNLSQTTTQAANKLPARETLQALLQSFDKQVPAERSLSMIAAGTTILAVIGVGFVLHVARPIMLPLAAAFIIAILLAPLADWLGRRGMPEGARAGIVVMFAAVALVAGLYFIRRPGVAWLDKLPEVAEEARMKLRGISKAVTQMQEVSKQVQEIASGPEKAGAPKEVVMRQAPMSETIIKAARNAVIQLLFTAVLAYFFLATRTSFRMKAMAARPSLKGKLQTARIIRDMQKKVGSYMFTMTLNNIGLGTAVGTALMAIGMLSPMVWGFLAGLLNFVPYLGPTVVTLLLAASGLVHYDTLSMGAAPALIYIALNFIESNVVTPSLIGVRLRISPLAIIVSIALLTWMWGAVGAIIAIPLVVFKTICDDVRFLRPIGVVIGEVEVVKGRKYGFCRIRTV